MRGTKLSFFLATAASLPLFLVHLAALMQKEHLQFVLLLPFLMWIVFRRKTDSKPTYSEGSSLGAWLTLFPVGLFIAACFFFSPWLHAFAILLTVPLVSLAVGGAVLFWRVIPVWLLFGFLVSLPFGIDQLLIRRLRNFATSSASSVLDLFGFPHIATGNLIQIPEHDLFVADACSGIHSLFVLLAFALIVVLWNSRSFFRSTFVLTGTLAIIMIENVARICIIAMAFRWGQNLSEGTPHMILGLVMFLISMLLVCSLDQLQNSFQFRTQGEFKSRKARTEFHGLKNPVTWPLSLLAGILCCLAPFTCVRIYGSSFNPLLIARSPLAIPTLAADTLPSSIGEFERTGFEIVERVAEDPFGLQSQIWTYRSADIQMRVSLDYPYAAIHDVATCYRNTGWSVLKEQVIGPVDQGDETFRSEHNAPKEDQPTVVAEMTNPGYGRAVLLWSAISSSGEVSVTIDSRRLMAQRNLIERFRRFETLPATEDFFQIQMIVLGKSNISEAERVKLATHYAELRSQLVQRCLSSRRLDLGVTE